MTITICICGAGTMGSGIAQVAAQSGFDTVLFDVNRQALQTAKATINENLDYLVNKRKIEPQDKSRIFSRIRFVDRLEDCVGFVIIEAIVEKLEAKVSLFNDLAKYNNEEVVFASNTSSLSITEIQEKVAFPERVVGMHFFNPAYVMKLVEVVRGRHTSEPFVEAVQDICVKMGKEPVICTDSPGFIVNRVARHFYLESLYLAENGLATVEDIDTILQASGFKMGPFRLMDLIGMDVNLAVSQSLYKAFDNAPRFVPLRLQEQKVENKELGKKTGKGFYDYSN